MRYLAGALLCAVLAQDARPCSLPHLLMREDPRVKVESYAGETVKIFTMNVRKSGAHAEYIAYLKELDTGAYVVLDDCGDKRCVDIYTDRNADGKIEDHYRIPFSHGIFGKIKAWWETRGVQGHVQDAMERGGPAQALQSLEHDLREYRVKDVAAPQEDYARHVADLRRELCSSRIAFVSSEESSVNDK